MSNKHFNLIRRLQRGLSLRGICQEKKMGVKVRWQQAVWDKWLWESRGAPCSSQTAADGFAQRKCGLWPCSAKCMLCMLSYMITKELTKGDEGYSHMLFNLQDIWSVAWIAWNMFLCLSVCVMSVLSAWLMGVLVCLCVCILVSLGLCSASVIRPHTQLTRGL